MVEIGRYIKQTKEILLREKKKEGWGEGRKGEVGGGGGGGEICSKTYRWETTWKDLEVYGSY